MTHFNPPQINIKKKTKATINITKLIAPETMLVIVRLVRLSKVSPAGFRLMVF